MKRWLCLVLMLVLMAWGGTTWAAYGGEDYFAESLIYAGPPGYEDVYDSGNQPTYVSGSAYGKDVEARADYWDVGGRLHNTWDTSYQGWIYAYTSFEKDFKVTKAGEATISFSWDGTLEVAGSSAYDEAGWYLYADAMMQDYRGTNPNVYWYEELRSMGSLNPSESTSFTYDFTGDDIGEIFTICLTLQTEVGGGGSIGFTGDDTLVFDSDFYNTLKIDSISGGIEAVGGPSPFPSPGQSGSWVQGCWAWWRSGGGKHRSDGCSLCGLVFVCLPGMRK